MGGAQSHVRDLAVALKEQGEQVTVLAGGNGGALFEALDRQQMDWRLLKNLVHPLNPVKDLQAFCEIKDLLRKLAPDLVTTHSNKAGFVGRLAAKALKIPVIHTSHGFLFGGREHSFSGYCYRFAEKIASGAADRVICVAESECELAKRLKVIKPEKLKIVHNGLPDVELKSLASADREPPILISVARFSKPKDHYTLLQALIGLTEYRWRLDLVGDGPKQKLIEKLVRNCSLAGKINFLGTRSDVPGLLAQSSIFILSSRREGFPLSILEAMRAGLPVIATDVGGISEALIDGETGFLVPAGDYSALRKRICALIEDPILRKQMGAKGRLRYLQHFTLEKMVDKTFDIYREVTKQ